MRRDEDDVLLLPLLLLPLLLRRLGTSHTNRKLSTTACLLLNSPVCMCVYVCVSQIDDAGPLFATTTLSVTRFRLTFRGSPKKKAGLVASLSTIGLRLERRLCA